MAVSEELKKIGELLALKDLPTDKKPVFAYVAIAVLGLNIAQHVKNTESNEEQNNIDLSAGILFSAIVLYLTFRCCEDTAGLSCTIALLVALGIVVSAILGASKYDGVSDDDTQTDTTRKCDTALVILFFVLIATNFFKGNGEGEGNIFVSMFNKTNLHIKASVLVALATGLAGLYIKPKDGDDQENTKTQSNLQLASEVFIFLTIIFSIANIQKI